MNEIIEKINSDPMLMLSSAIAVVVLLFVVLVVLVASMRVKTYRDRFINIRIDNMDKEKRIVQLEEELQELKIKNAQNEQALEQFGETKKRLFEREEMLVRTQKELAQTQSRLSQTKTQLENAENIYERLLAEHKSLKERFDTLNDENNKLHISNARLLMKLETEERFSSQLQQRNLKEKGGGE